MAGQRVYWPALQELLLALACLYRSTDRFGHRLVPDHAQVDQVAGFIVSIVRDIGRAVLVEDLGDSLQKRPVDLAADPLQLLGHEGLAALRRDSVDLLEQVVGTFARWHVTQDDFPIGSLDRRQAASPVDHNRHWLDGCVAGRSVLSRAKPRRCAV